MSGQPTILIVDDEPDLRWLLRGLFEEAGYQVVEAADGEAALRIATTEPLDVVLSDVRMPKLAGTELLRRLQRQAPEVPVVLLSAVEDIATAVRAIQDGAFDYQAKPFDPDRLRLTVQRATEQRALRREVADLRSGRAAPPDFGTSKQAHELRRTLDLIAGQATLSTLIIGESGTGKEVIAREIHRRSPVHAGPFVAIDCGALPEPLMESQLFGHRRGAFTGADKDRAGLFQAADGGTLFLDELGNLPLALQQKLLRALQERTVVPVGGSEPVPFRARLLTATNADLGEDMRSGRFRVDLYHRIAEFTLRLAPLRERTSDILHFAQRFLTEANIEMGRHVQGLQEAASLLLQRHPWPGNLRELRNVIRRAVLVCSDALIGPEHLGLIDGSVLATTGQCPQTESQLPLAERIQQATDALEAEILRTTLLQSAGNKAAAARALQIDYTTLHRKLKRHGIDA
jgi:DNA-binding NtrC family response regulator